ncbi:MAG: extracellular solute-binding protein, partial [Burkholderiales bacterium]|nr:extracellular solute-binding protein [Burkholderiales bacterium]
MRMATQKLKTSALSWAGLLLAGCVVTLAQAQQSITVAAYPAVDEIAKAAVTQWKKKHPTVEVKVVSRAFADHHTAMTTALSTSSNLPDVMVVEFGYVARFAEGGGLEDLGAAPYAIKTQQARFVPFAFRQATAASG